MAGSKTRFGFAGDGSEPPDSEESRAAPTVYGHDIHLQLPPGFVPPRPPGSPTPLPPAPPGRTRQQPTPVQTPEQEMAEVMPARSPSRPHTSRLARFFGRWTGSGRFVSRSRMGDDDDDENLELPRDTTGRNVLLVLVVAILTFSLTFAIVRLRQQSAATTPGAKAQLSAIPQPPPATPPPTPAAAPPAPLPPPPAAQIPVKPSFPAPPAPSAASKGLGPPPPEPSAQHPKAARTSAHSAEPPTHLKGELLPLGP